MHLEHEVHTHSSQSDAPRKTPASIRLSIPIELLRSPDIQSASVFSRWQAFKPIKSHIHSCISHTMTSHSPSRSDLPTVSDCNSCGICCHHMGYPSFITESRPKLSGGESQIGEPAWINMPDSLKQDLLEYIRNYKPPAGDNLDGPCCWYDAEHRRCKHHEHRPDVCRDFTVGGKGCLEWRQHYRQAHPEYLP